MPTPTSILLAAAALVPVLAAKGTVIDEVVLKPESFTLMGKNGARRIVIAATFNGTGTIAAVLDIQTGRSVKTRAGVGDDHTAAVLAAIK